VNKPGFCLIKNHLGLSAVSNKKKVFPLEKTPFISTN